MNTTSRRASAAALAAAGVLTFSGGFALLAGSADASPSVISGHAVSTDYPSETSTPSDNPTTPSDSPSYPSETPTTPTDTPTTPSDSPSYPSETPTTPTDTPSTPPTTPPSTGVSPSTATPSPSESPSTTTPGVSPSTAGPSPSGDVPRVVDSGLAGTTQDDAGQQMVARGLLVSGLLLVLGSVLYVVGVRRRGLGER